MSRFSEKIAKGYQARLQNRKSVNALMIGLTGFATLLALVPLFWIVGYVIYMGAPSLNIEFFTQLPRPVGMAGGGVLHAIQGTLIVTILAALFALPPGVLAAFYASRYPNTPLGIALRFSTDVLSGVPSIVIGLFVYALMVKPMGHYSGLAGGVALAILMLPTIIRTTEEMLKLVPHTLREGSLALGAAEWKTSFSVLFPAAFSGIVTGFLLALARAMGETAPLLFTALGNERYNVSQIVTSGVQGKQGFLRIMERVIDQPLDSLPLTLWKYASQPYPERVSQSWGVALVLMIFVLLLNIIARLWIASRAKKLRG
ncbi:MAG: phosphate ABC transporter permease PstA [Chloroflexi bacterium]|nr:phosphate ABC transporter permease PstA [Chloroflexota bacterium]